MTHEEIVEVLTNIRREIPDAVIRTQFIVGFKGNRRTIRRALQFVEEQRFDRGLFQILSEDNTPGGKMQDQVAEDIKEDRFDRLMALQQEISGKNTKTL